MRFGAARCNFRVEKKIPAELILLGLDDEGLFYHFLLVVEKADGAIDNSTRFVGLINKHPRSDSGCIESYSGNQIIFHFGVQTPFRRDLMINSPAFVRSISRKIKKIWSRSNEISIEEKGLIKIICISKTQKERSEAQSRLNELGNEWRARRR